MFPTSSLSYTTFGTVFCNFHPSTDRTDVLGCVPDRNAPRDPRVRPLGRPLPRADTDTGDTMFGSCKSLVDVLLRDEGGRDRGCISSMLGVIGERELYNMRP